MKTMLIGEIVDSISQTHTFNKEKLYFLNTSDVLEGAIINHNLVSISNLKGQAKKSIKNGDILFSEIRPKNKRYAIVNVPNPEDYVVSTKLMVLRMKTREVDQMFFYYNLVNDSMLNLLQSRAENRIGSFPQITYELLSEYSIPVPSIEQQLRITNIVQTIESNYEI